MQFLSPPCEQRKLVLQSLRLKNTQISILQLLRCGRRLTNSICCNNTLLSSPNKKLSVNMPKRRKNREQMGLQHNPEYLRCRECEENDVGPAEAAAPVREGQVPHCRHLLPAHRMNTKGKDKKSRSIIEMMLNIDLLVIYRFIILSMKLWAFLFQVQFIYARGFTRLFFPRSRKSKRRLNGKVALVTGAGSDVGRELCMQLHEMGATLVCVDSDAKGAAVTARKVSDSGGAAVHYQVDVGDREQVKQLTQRIMDEVGDVDILVNNADVARVRPFLDHSDVQIEKVINTNLYGNIWMLRAILPRFVKKGHGSVVSLCGVAGYGGFPNMLPFVASKFAVRGLMEGLYIELRQKYPRHNIHLMTVAPFSIDTGMVQGSLISFPITGMFKTSVRTKEAVADIIDGMMREEVVLFLPKFLFYFFTFVRTLPLRVQLLMTDFIDTAGLRLGYDLKDD